MSDSIQKLELCKHNRHRISVGIGSVLPFCFMIAISLIIQHPGPLILSLLFVVVGAFNLYIFEARPVADRIIFLNDSISSNSKTGHFSQPLSNVVAVREIRMTLRGRQRLEIDFKDGSILPVYTHAMRIDKFNNQSVKFRFTDLFHPSWRIWDRPVLLVREYFMEHNLLTAGS